MKDSTHELAVHRRADQRMHVSISVDSLTKPGHARRYTRVVDLLENKDIDGWSYELFRVFLKDEYSIENLLFYEDSKAYMNEPDVNKRRQLLRNIHIEYFTRGSDHEIHSVNRSFLIEKILSGCTDVDLLNDAHAEVLRTLQIDSFPRFLRSEVSLRERPDTPRTLRSREKLQDFFGEQIKGDLQREELLSFVRKSVSVSKRERVVDKKRFRRWNKLASTI